MSGFDLGTESGLERARLAMSNFGIAFFESDLNTGLATISPNAFTMFGLPPPDHMPADSTPFWDCYHPDDRDDARAKFQADLRGDRGQDSYHERVRIIRRTDQRIRWIEFLGHMFGPPGARTHIVGMLRDITEIVESEERQQLLMREVNHRANNTLAVAQALTRLTKASTVEDFKVRLEARLLSLSRSQSLLETAGQGPSDIEALVDTELAAYRDLVEVQAGSAPQLGPAALQPVAMVLHELATNAAKHGALGDGQGRVRIDCGLLEDVVRLRWTERGGPPVLSPPGRAGTGLAVIRGQIRRLGGRMESDWHPAGLVMTAWFPAANWRR